MNRRPCVHGYVCMYPPPKLMGNGEPTVHLRFSYRTKGNVDARFHIVVLYKKRKILYMWVALHVPATHAYKLFYLVTFLKKKVFRLLHAFLPEEMDWSVQFELLLRVPRLYSRSAWSRSPGLLQRLPLSQFIEFISR